MKGEFSIDADSGPPRYVLTDFLMLWWYLSPARHLFKLALALLCESNPLIEGIGVGLTRGQFFEGLFQDHHI